MAEQSDSSAPILFSTLAALAGLSVGVAIGWILFSSPAQEVQLPEPVADPTPPPPMAPSKDQVRYQAVAFADLPGFLEDPVEEALPALERSCVLWGRMDPQRPVGPGGIGGFAEDWREACSEIPDVGASGTDVRAWLTTYFTPFAVSGPDKNTGTFTGYYEASLNGSFERSERFDTPIFARPESLISVELGRFDDGLAGQRILGRVQDQGLAPYYTRAEIDTGGVLGADAEVLLWADDPVDVHILHIQGSGRVFLPDGSNVRVGYAENNGHRFTGIGGVLLRAGVLGRGQGSMPGVRQWLKENPEAAAGFMNENDRYIFFRLIEGDGPIGAAGVPLTPLRSLAVDRSVIPLNAPIWLDVDDPDGVALERLMVAQDIGAAIKGYVRGDIFWGSGEAAFQKAGRMNKQGVYYLLLPNRQSMDPA